MILSHALEISGVMHPLKENFITAGLLSYHINLSNLLIDLFLIPNRGRRNQVNDKTFSD